MTTAEGQLLRDEIRELRTALYAGGGERGISLQATAACLGFHPDTLRHWLRLHLFHAHDLLRKEGGRWRSSPHRIEHWRYAVEADRRKLFYE